MKRLILTLCIAAIALIILGFAYVAVTDAPVVRQEIVKTIPQPATTGTPTP